MKLVWFTSFPQS